MKAVKIMLLGRERYLSFTVGAMYKIREEFGGTSELLEVVNRDTQEGFSATVNTIVLLAEQGELARRNLGYEETPFLRSDELAATTTPGDMYALKRAIPAAITLGFGREIVPEDDEIDLGLAELNAQKKTT